MDIRLYFGLPGAGKTTLLAKMARDSIISGKYKNVYGNVHMALPGYTYIDNECIGLYDLSDCIIFIDEGTLFANNREYKTFPKRLLKYMCMHRHYRAQICIFSQRWDSLDLNIRTLTSKVFYIYKGKFLGYWFTRVMPIPYGIIIPDGKKSDGEKLGEIIQGYSKPPLLVRLFSPFVYRPRYYKYFDSWECEQLPPLPPHYKPYALPDGNVTE